MKVWRARLESPFGEPYVNILRELYRIFRSTRLAVTLLIIIAASSALSTLVPQGKELQYYFNNYSPFFAHLITISHFHRFFRSVFFLLPSGVFFINLAVCTVHRLAWRVKTRAPKRYGPDLIHSGILLLMVGGLVSLLGRQEWYIYLSPGEYTELPDGYQLFLTSFNRTTYEDGRPKEYVSAVEIRKNGKREGYSEIKVNKPLKTGNVKIYQDSYKSTSSLILYDEQNKKYLIRQGDGFRIRDRHYFYTGIEPGPGTAWVDKGERAETYLRSDVVILDEYDQNGNPVQLHRLSVSDAIDAYIIKDIIKTEHTGLRIVQDKGYTIVLIAFIVIGAGLALTFMQTLKEKSL